MTRVTVIDI